MSNLTESFWQVGLGSYSLSRRRLVHILGLGTAGLLLAACADDDDADVDPVEDPADDDEPVDPDDDEDAPAETDDVELEGPEGLAEYAQIVGPPVDDPFSPAIGTPRFGGDLNIASHDEPVTLDGQLNTRSVVQYLAAMVCEGLFSWNLDGESVPMLAESHEWNEDNTQITVALRQGVLFHDGSEFTADDVEATVNRWTQVPLGSDMADVIESMETPDDYTIVFNLSESFPFFQFRTTARQAASLWIYSREQVESLAEPTDDIGVPIGTGPYQFEEWRENQFLHLSRFDNYVGREEPPSGEGGGKVAYIDNIYFRWVTDESVRIAGLQTGEYQMAENIIPDHYERFDGDADPDIRTRLTLATWPCVHFNLWRGPMTDLTTRQAFCAALDVRQIAAAMGSEVFFPLSPSLVPGEDSPWYSNVGEDVYLEYDPDRARELLAESEYDGQELRWLVNPDSDTSYTPGVVAQPMLEEVGFNIELVPLDGATLAAYRADEDRMEAFGCGWAPQPDPTLMAMLTHGGWDTERKREIFAQMRAETDQEVRFGLWDEMQELYYTELPGMKFADQNALVLESEQYSGSRIEVIYYYIPNTWLNE